MFQKNKRSLFCPCGGIPPLFLVRKNPCSSPCRGDPPPVRSRSLTPNTLFFFWTGKEGRNNMFSSQVVFTFKYLVQYSFYLYVQSISTCTIDLYVYNRSLRTRSEGGTLQIIDLTLLFCGVQINSLLTPLVRLSSGRTSKWYISLPFLARSMLASLDA